MNPYQFIYQILSRHPGLPWPGESRGFSGYVQSVMLVALHQATIALALFHTVGHFVGGWHLSDTQASAFFTLLFFVNMLTVKDSYYEEFETNNNLNYKSMFFIVLTSISAITTISILR